MLAAENAGCFGRVRSWLQDVVRGGDTTGLSSCQVIVGFSDDQPHQLSGFPGADMVGFNLRSDIRACFMFPLVCRLVETSLQVLIVDAYSNCLVNDALDGRLE